MVKFYLILLLLLTSFHHPKGPEMTAKEVWELRGKWRLDIEKISQREYKQHFTIEVVDHETFHWREVLINSK